MKPSRNRVVPTDYVSWQEIFHIEKLNFNNFVPKYNLMVNKCNKAMWEMGFTDDPKQDGKRAKSAVQKFADYYNVLHNGLITDKAINQFYNIGRLEPVAHQFKMFVRQHVSRDGNNPVTNVDFGIYLKHWEHYKNTGRPVNTLNRGRPRKTITEPGKNKRTKLTFPEGGVIDLPIDPQYQRLKDGVQKANSLPETTRKVTLIDVIRMAMVEYMDARPDIFGDSPDTFVDERLLRQKTNEHIRVTVDRELNAKVWAAMERYNADNHTPITMSQIVEAALDGFYKRWEIKYTNPTLWAELQKKDGADG